MHPDALERLIYFIAAALAAIGGILIKYGFQQGKQSEQLKRLSEDVKDLRDGLDLMKDSLMRRADAELLNKGPGWATKKSPLHLGQMAIDSVMPLIDMFVPFYVDLLKARPDITERDLFWEVEQKFGELLVEKVCTTNNLSNLGCVKLIIELCKMKEGQPHATATSEPNPTGESRSA